MRCVWSRRTLAYLLDFSGNDSSHSTTSGNFQGDFRLSVDILSYIFNAYMYSRTTGRKKQLNNVYLGIRVSDACLSTRVNFIHPLSPLAICRIRYGITPCMSNPVCPTIPLHIIWYIYIYISIHLCVCVNPSNVQSPAQSGFTYSSFYLISQIWRHTGNKRALAFSLALE